MAKWGEIKCERCDEQDALWEGMERSLEESDAREARLEARIEELEAENAKLKQMWWDAGDVTDLAGTIAELEAKLAEAVETLRTIEDASRLFARYRKSDIEKVRYAHECTRGLCAATLAELNYDERSEKKGQD